MANSYYTIEEKIIFEQVIDKSRFIAVIIPISQLEDFHLKMDWVKTEYPNARHYVYAYRLLKNRLEKGSDDGEPQGTGGRPILELLQHRNVWDVLVVVVRYFGGILLGTGGLTRAYGGTARKGLEQRPLISLTLHNQYRLTLSYQWYEPVTYQLRQRILETKNETFEENVSFSVFVPANESVEFENWIDEFSSKQVKWIKEKEVMRRPIK